MKSSCVFVPLPDYSDQRAKRLPRIIAHIPRRVCMDDMPLIISMVAYAVAICIMAIA